VLVQPGDPRALAVAIERLLNDRHLARTLGARAACKAAAEYEVSAMVHRYNSIYDVILTH
jgi:glycosyltransferase involved in cell wall biosynthesis